LKSLGYQPTSQDIADGMPMETIHNCLIDAISTHIKESPKFALKISSLVRDNGLTLFYPIPRFVTKEEIIKKDVEVINKEIYSDPKPIPIFYQVLSDYWDNRLIYSVDVGNLPTAEQERILKDYLNEYWDSTPKESSFVTTTFTKKVHENFRQILKDLDYTSTNAKYAKKYAGVTPKHFPCDERTGESLRKTLIAIMDDYPISS
jgi:hypothetical protein